MNYDAFSEKLLQNAQSRGCEAAEAYFLQSDSFHVAVFRGEIDEYNVANRGGLCLRILKDGHMGYAYSEALDDMASEFLVENAFQNAEMIESKDPQFIFSGSEQYETVSQQPDQATDAREKIQLALDMEKHALALSDQVSHVSHCIVATGNDRVAIQNTFGLKLSHQDHYAMAYLSVVVKNGERTYTGQAQRATHLFSELNAEEIAQEAVEDALAYIGAQSIPSKNMPVVLRNDMMSALLNTFLGCFSADVAQKGMSLLRGLEGESVAAPCVTLIDDPLLRDGFASTPFDAEGVATHTKDVIENGVLKTLLHNLKTASKQGVETTGNAHKSGYADAMGVAPTNFFIQKSEIKRSELFEQMGEGLFITDLAGMHSGANAISGDFSLAAKGFIVRDGKIGTPVEQITIAGNFFTLMKQIRAVGEDLWFDVGSCSVGSPSIWIDTLSIAGEGIGE